MYDEILEPSGYDDALQWEKDEAQWEEEHGQDRDGLFRPEYSSEYE